MNPASSPLHPTPPSGLPASGQTALPQANPLVEQLKAQMHDIAEPTAISWWPLAWGWWVVIAMAAIGLAIIIGAWVMRYRRNRYRREAIAALQKSEFASHHTQAQYFMRISKQVALTAYPSQRQYIASAFGQDWLTWLNNTTPKPLFDNDLSRDWQASLYQEKSHTASDALTELMVLWVKKHHSSASKLSRHKNGSHKNSSHKKNEEVTDV